MLFGIRSAHEGKVKMKKFGKTAAKHRYVGHKAVNGNAFKTCPKEKKVVVRVNRLETMSNVPDKNSTRGFHS